MCRIQYVWPRVENSEKSRQRNSWNIQWEFPHHHQLEGGSDSSSKMADQPEWLENSFKWLDEVARGTRPFLLDTQSSDAELTEIGMVRPPVAPGSGRSGVMLSHSVENSARTNVLLTII